MLHALLFGSLEQAEKVEKEKALAQQEVYIHIYTHTHTHIYIYIYIYIIYCILKLISVFLSTYLDYRFRFI